MILLAGTLASLIDLRGEAIPEPLDGLPAERAAFHPDGERVLLCDRGPTLSSHNGHL